MSCFASHTFGKAESVLREVNRDLFCGASWRLCRHDAPELCSDAGRAGTSWRSHDLSFAQTSSDPRSGSVLRSEDDASGFDSGFVRSKARIKARRMTTFFFYM
jgi:hypothetical protein